MNLKQTINQQNENLLPRDGIVNYHGVIFTLDESDRYLEALLEHVDWKNDELLIFGKQVVTRRKTAWYGDRPFKYTYSNVSKTALPWTGALLNIKNTVEQLSGETFNSCLLNLYHDGRDAMSWHCDNEPELKKNGAIASLSFGAERKFCFKHRRTKETVSLLLQHGSLLVMKGEIQVHWLHRLPPSVTIKVPRVNMTFRTIINDAA